MFVPESAEVQEDVSKGSPVTSDTEAFTATKAESGRDLDWKI